MLVSHDPRSIELFCDRAILLEGGRILAQGPGRIVAARYLELLAGRAAEASNADTAGSRG